MNLKTLKKDGTLPLVSYHNHSNWSDGLDSLEDMILGARERGLAEYGLSDHWVERPDGSIEEWSMPMDALDAYVDTCLKLKETYSTEDFRILLSLEVEYYTENAEEVMAKLKTYPFDYLIGAVHSVGDFPVDTSAEDWKIFTTQDEIDAIFHGYWKKELSLCRSGLYDLIAHLDLPKKFGYSASYDTTAEWTACLEAIAASGCAMELNTAGWDKDCADGYPSAPVLRRARELGLPLVLSSDSHEVRHIARHYEKGAAALGAMLVPPLKTVRH